jgi:WD40 repeat protein
LNLNSERTGFYKKIVSIDETNTFCWFAESDLEDVIISCDGVQNIEIGRCEVGASASFRWTTATFLATQGNNAFLSWSTGSDGVCFILCSSSGKKLLENCDNGIEVSPDSLFVITYPPVGTPLVMSRTVQIYDLRTGYLLLKYELESETDVRSIEWLENYVRLGIVNKNGMESQIVL